MAMAYEEIGGGVMKLEKIWGLEKGEIIKTIKGNRVWAWKREQGVSPVSEHKLENTRSLFTYFSDS